MVDSMQDTVRRMRAKAMELDQDVAHVGQYANYALFTTSAVEIYGEDNLVRLRRIRDVIDPEGVFDLTGGFKLGEVHNAKDGRIQHVAGDKYYGSENPLAAPALYGGSF